jgi:hypothetical protein
MESGFPLILKLATLYSNINQAIFLVDEGMYLSLILEGQFNPKRVDAIF